LPSSKKIKNIAKKTYYKTGVGIKKLKNLKSLNLRRNSMLSIEHIKNLKKLEYLNLSYNNMFSLSCEIGELKNLTELNLDGNSLVELPPQIKKLQKLTSLHLYQNPLKKINEVPLLKNLKYLHCENVIQPNKKTVFNINSNLSCPNVIIIQPNGNVLSGGKSYLFKDFIELIRIEFGNMEVYSKDFAEFLSKRCSNLS
jgi:Leucine-rich repeat (LRR) protein